MLQRQQNIRAAFSATRQHAHQIPQNILHDLAAALPTKHDRALGILDLLRRAGEQSRATGKGSRHQLWSAGQQSSFGALILRLALCDARHDGNAIVSRTHFWELTRHWDPAATSTCCLSYILWGT